MNQISKKECKILQNPNSLFYLRDDDSIYEMIMHVGLRNFEEKSAEIVGQNGGDILEIGFGMGLSSNKFQSLNINSHTCIEINDNLFLSAQTWANGKNNVTIINDSWQNYLTGTTSKFDAIYCDYLDADDYIHFYESAKNVLKTNGIISTYGAGIYLEINDFNVFESITEIQNFDSEFTKETYDRLVLQGFYKVYWQYYNGTNYVKNIN